MHAYLTCMYTIQTNLLDHFSTELGVRPLELFAVLYRLTESFLIVCAARTSFQDTSPIYRSSVNQYICAHGDRLVLQRLYCMVLPSLVSEASLIRSAC